jgi:hypothetical protein
MNLNTGASLESQHRELEKLFFRIANASDSETRTQLFEELADHLLAYAAIEGQMATSCAWSVRTAGTGP